MAKLKNNVPFQRHALVLALALATGAGHAATLEVTGDCSLIKAIINANTDADMDGVGVGCPAGSGADTLNLVANKVYLLKKRNNINAGPNGLPAIASVITINGNNAIIKRVSTEGSPDFRLFRIVSGGNLTLNSVKLTGGRLGNSYQYGGAIMNSGQLTLNNSTVTGNHNAGVGSSGSAIANMYQSTLTLNNSTIANNTASRGAGIANFPVATAIINNSTISGNVSSNSGVGGIANGGTMTLTNSTVSSNRSLASWGTGGIANSSDGTLTLNHSTVSDNAIGYGSVAGIANSGDMTLINSIVANSKKGGDCYTNTRYGGSIVFQGKTIIEDGTCNTTLSGDPKLLPLLDNGGPTLTHALRGASPAVNAANTLCVAIDQRYVSRPQPTTGICDLGAFERITPKPSSVSGLVSFFDTQAASAGLVGIGLNATFKLDALRNQLLTAGNYKNASLDTQACGQLSKSLARLDADGTADANDYVTGSQIAALITQINALRTSWSCP